MSVSPQSTHGCFSRYSWQYCRLRMAWSRVPFRIPFFLTLLRLPLHLGHSFPVVPFLMKRLHLEHCRRAIPILSGTRYKKSMVEGEGIEPSTSPLSGSLGRRGGSRTHDRPLIRREL